MDIYGGDFFAAVLYAGVNINLQLCSVWGLFSKIFGIYGDLKTLQMEAHL